MRRIAARVCVQERLASAISIALSGVAVSPNPENLRSRNGAVSTEVALANVLILPGEMGMQKRRFAGDFHLDRSFVDLRGRGYSNATQSNRDHSGRTLLNTDTLCDPSLSQFCPAERSPLRWWVNLLTKFILYFQQLLCRSRNS